MSVMAGVSSGELAKFFLKHNVCWMSNATLPSVQMGGLIAPACHVSTRTSRFEIELTPDSVLEPSWKT